MAIEFAGRSFELVRASDIHRDGMGLELYEIAGGEREMLAEVFYFDETGRFTFSGYAEDIPLEAVEWFLAQAHERLPLVAPPDTPPTTERRDLDRQHN